MPRTKAPAKPTAAPASGPDLVDELVAQFEPKLVQTGSWSGMSPDDVPAGKALLAAGPATRAAAFGAVLDHLKAWYREYTAFVASRGPRQTPARRRAEDLLDARRCLLVSTLCCLRRPTRPPLTDRTAAKVVEWRLREQGGFGPWSCHIEMVWDIIRPHAVHDGLGPHLRKAIGRLIRQFRKTGFVNELKHADKFEGLLAGRRSSGVAGRRGLG